MSNHVTQKELMTALEWYVDQGVHDILQDDPIDRTVIPEPVLEEMPAYQALQSTPAPSAAPQAPQTSAYLGKTDAYEEAVKLAKQVKTLDELKEAIAEFDGVAIKKMATNLVFSAGNPEASIMFIGDAPAADEDRQGAPFAGACGQLLDRILACIDLDRGAEDIKNAVYLTNILNWRPPGNRSPAPAEIEVSLPFIEKHIQLIQPKLLVLLGGVSAKHLLGRSESISKLRKKWHDYMPVTQGLGADISAIPTIVTYHPSYLLKTPIQKRAVWDDMLSLQDKRKTL